MEPHEVRTAADARRIVEERGLDWVKLGVFDVDGVLRGKYVSRDKFFSALDHGFGFCDVVLGWDCTDALYDNVRFTGWHTGYPDAPVRIVPQTCRELPEGDEGLLFVCEFAGDAEALCPRGALRRVVERARAMGFEPWAAVEYEFFVFDETPASLHDKGFRNLQPLTPGNFGYSVLRNSVWAEFHTGLLRLARRMRLDLEGLHTETGPGVIEAALAVDRGVGAGDRAALFKTFCKVYAQRCGKTATFMARWSDKLPGQSGHLHVSLRSTDGGMAFADDAAADGMSETMRHFIGGCLAFMPELTALVAPTVNSYKRLVPGFWAPTAATWGVENRTCALRAIVATPKARRVEHRVAGADANPYLALAAALASGLEGIERRIDPGAPLEGNAYEFDAPPNRRLPRTLDEAADRFEASAVARKWLGDAFVEHFAATRRWEARAYRKAVTDWELERYFEII